MDALSDILRKVKLSSSVYFRSDFPSPWGMDLPASPYAQFHMIVRGHCWLKVEGSEETVGLSAGDIVVFPVGKAHWLADDPNCERLRGQDVLTAICNNRPVFNGGKISTTLVCGHFEFDNNFDHPFLEALPELIHLPSADHHQLSWLETATNVMIQETGSKRPGVDIVVERLAEVLFIQILRSYMERTKHERGFLAALRDNQINSALNLIHKKPTEPWTLESLAKSIGMSRSSFATRFKQLVEMTPMDYITNWRMLKAKELLANSRLPLIDVAEQIGYTSEAAFNRAFKRRFNQNPGAMRREGRQNTRLLRSKT